ncbi:unnamed protein product, partial [Mesorhabditis belari]|uniref:Anosmin-1 n=1 Tax=Mesorhabditis belari TaxID=2138241 RepID=A0AAF3EG15_9BILA
MRRNLKHHILTICKEDRNCSACTTPCRETLSDTGKCGQNACLESFDVSSCERSCDFLHEIFSEKPGACPVVNNVSNYECTAECRLDGDCLETSKCCAWGCSRRCLQPVKSSTTFKRKSLFTIPPLPSTITVQERKRKRSAVVRWESKGGQDLSDLYVIEWRWGLHPEAMTNWQTVALKNKDYAILKHLLSPGRFYQFRVAAVNRFGTHGFSEPSQPFKLSKEARAPGPPRELSLGEAKLDGEQWRQSISWTQPLSDLPITGYQVSWAISNDQELKSYEEMLRRQASTDKHEKRDVDEEEWTIVERDRTTVIVPSHSTQTFLERLDSKTVYLIEIQAMADSAEGQLNGEKAVTFVKTKGFDELDELDKLEKNENPLPNVPTGAPGKVEEVDRLHVETPHFTDSLIIPINWLNSRICGPKRRTFNVKYSPEKCANGHSLNKKNEEKTQDCSISLQNLDFQCTYLVQIFVDDQEKPGVIGSFETRSCEETPTTGKAPCDFERTKLRCAWDFASIECNWDRLIAGERDTIIGYRLVLSSALRDDHNISILPPQTRRTRFDGVIPSKEYHVEIQPITNRGVGVAETVIIPAIEEIDPSDPQLNQLESLNLLNGTLKEKRIEKWQ